MAAESLLMQVAVWVQEVFESGYYEWKNRALSRERSDTHGWPTSSRQVHQSSRGTSGARRAHVELVLGHGISVWHGAVEMLMRRAGIVGVTGRPKWRHIKPGNIASDRVGRVFAMSEPN
jgi:putative transposase